MPVVNVTVATPLPFVVEVAALNAPPVPVFDHVTTLPEVEIALPTASVSCAVIVTPAPATGEAALDVTTYFAAAPAEAVIVPDVPVSAPSVAVTVCSVPMTVWTVKTTVAMPEAFVVDVADANEPPAPVFDQVTTLPLVPTVLPCVSESCAVMVTLLPAAGVVELDVTTNFVAAPATDVKVPDVPLSAPASVAVTVYADTALPVVKTTVAFPVASVADVALANVPSVPVFDQVITFPLVATAFPAASASWAVMVTVEPTTGEALLDVTAYFAGGPMLATMLPLVPVIDVLSVAVTV